MFKGIFKSTVMAFTALAVTAGASQAAELRLNGSATVAKTVIGPNLQKLQTNTGLTFKIVANGSGNGLKDLAAGRADMAMISAPLQVEADITNGKAPGSLNISGMEAFPIGYSTISFVVHPSNPVKSLTEEQVADILSGRISNWSDVGGANKPIQLIAEKPGQGTRSTIEHLLMSDQRMASKARQVPALSQVTKIVSQLPTAFGYGNASSINSAVSVIGGVTVQQPLALVAKGSPTADMRKLIAASSALGS